ncbi:MAG: NADPH:quinone reductase [Boseongicola sp.]|nr:NADPH:quinone reductase [Boseongicola sp.]NNJ66926.1 NADPH:quinone reductase [Boseongicola sp.]
MKAAIYEASGPAEDVLKLAEITDPVPGKGEVLVRVAYSAVHPSDVKTRAGLRGALAFPRIIPHSDGSGRIVAVGAGVDPARIGQSVWLWNAAWARADGTAAELVSIPSDQAVDLPEGVDFETGATLGIPAITAHRCLFSDGPVTGQTVLVTGGAGTVGSMAIQMAKRGGATVIATVSGETKARHATAMGADHVVNYHEADVVDQIRRAAGKDGVDRIVEVEFGGNLEVTKAVIAEGGTVAAYGSAQEPEPVLPFYALMFMNVTLRMVLAYTIPLAARRAAEVDITKWLADGSLKGVVADRFDLDDVVLAHQSVESGQRIGVTLVRVSDAV